jgi:hypothetical protein
VRHAVAIAWCAFCACEATSPVVITPAGDSNVRASDYVGPARCGECHADNHALWRDSLHSTMNQIATPTSIVGDFDNARVAYGGREARFERDGDDHLMILDNKRYRVTRTIGTTYLQEYVGVEVGGSDREIRLPFGWWMRRPGWYPQPYFDSWFGAERAADGTLAFDPFVPDPAPWAGRCAWCHNTYPFELRAARGDHVGNGFERYVSIAPTIAATAVLPVAQLVTLGISCESCHLGGRSHAAAAATRDDPPISFVPRGDGVTPRPGAPDLSAGRDSPAVIDAICGQCHSTPSPRFPDGAAARNSSEALAMAAGACASKIACTDCHDPHARQQPSDVTKYVDACTACHADIDGTHARHDPTVTCLDCHMPRITQGIGALVRSHRISSPGDPAMIAAGAPDACGLCHLDRSSRWLQRELAAYDIAIAIDPTTADIPLGMLWLRSPSGSVRITAAAAFARSPRASIVPELINLLDDQVAYYRMFSLFAVEDALGRRITEYDPMAPPHIRHAQVDQLISALRSRARSGKRAAPPSR